ncbi:MAG: hypothetical protein P8Y11_12210 [Gemmatimonadales bacterium]
MSVRSPLILAVATLAVAGCTEGPYEPVQAAGSSEALFENHPNTPDRGEYTITLTDFDVCGVDQVSGDVVYDYVAQQWSGNNGMIHFFYLENGNGTLTGASGNTWIANETWHFESQFYPPSVGQDQTLFRVHLRFISQGPLPDFELMSVFQGVISNGELRVLRLEDWPPPPSCP